MRVVLLLPSASLPTYGSAGAGGMDLTAAEGAVVPPSRVTHSSGVQVGRALIRTGIAVQLPKGTVGRIGSRSGLSIQRNVEVGAGWIDPDYRGELLVELKNLGDEPLPIQPGDRIAQLFVLVTKQVRPRSVTRLSHAARGSKGFGSTGIAAPR